MPVKSATAILPPTVGHEGKTVGHERELGEENEIRSSHSAENLLESGKQSLTCTVSAICTLSATWIPMSSAPRIPVVFPPPPHPSPMHPASPDRKAPASVTGSEAPRPWPSGDDHLTPFLPMVYVAWSDGVLSPEEMARIREHLRETEALPGEARKVLESWLRPDAPPSAVALAELRDRIREVAARIPAEEQRSLVQLGVALARKSAEDEGGWATAEGLRVLEVVEDLLGVLGREAVRDLTDTPAPEPPLSAEPPREIDPAALARTLAGPRPELRARILALLTDPGVRVPDGLPTAEARERVLSAVRQLANERIGSLGYPEEHGGQDDVVGSLVAFETLGFGNLSVLVKFGVQFGLFGGSVLQLGTDRHHRRYLARIGSLELPGIYGMTERSHGSNVRQIETLARYLPETHEFEIHTPHPGARKDWLGNAALHGRVATVFAQLEVDGEAHGVHALLVPVRDERGQPLPGIEIEDCGEKVGLHGVDNGRLGFDRVRIPRENLLDRFGTVTPEGSYHSPITSPGRRFFTMLGTLVAGRISIAAAAVSATKTSLAIAVRYSAARRQFGPSGSPEVPILDYLTQQRMLLPAVATTYALHFATQDLFQEYAAATDTEARSRVEVLAAGLKSFASRHAQETIQACREALGGRGYLADNRLGHLREDTDIFTTFEGANVVLLQLVAKGLLTRYQDDLGDLRLWGIIKLVGERAGEEAMRRNPVRSRRTSEDYLRNPETLKEALEFRESRLLNTAAGRLKHRIDEGMDSFDAMTAVQDHLVHLARAHVERVVLDSFLDAVERTREKEGEAAAETLDRLVDLYGLSRIERDRSWFLESGYMEPSQSKAVRSAVNTLCGKIRPIAVELVDAFGIPDGVLAAPAAFQSGDEVTPG